MPNGQTKRDSTTCGDPEAAHRKELSEEQLADLENPDKQRHLREAYLLQMKRLGCPGCGEDAFRF